MIKQFHVQNYKALQDVTLDLTPIHVLIGPNDSGKTSILEAVAAFCRSVDVPIADAFAGTWIGRQLAWKNHRVAVRFDAAFDPEPYRYAFDVRFDDKDRRAQVVKETVKRESELICDCSDMSDKTLICSERPRHVIEHRNNWPSSSEIIHYELENVQFLRLDPRMLSVPVAAQPNRPIRLEPSGFGLARCLDHLLGFERDEFNRLELRFREIFPQVKAILLKSERGVEIVEGEYGTTSVRDSHDGKGLYFSLVDQTVPIPAFQMSEGILLVLAYLIVLYLADRPRVLLIEEPENGIHPKRLQEVLAILRQLVSEQQHTQIILTTHSPYVLDSFQPEEVTLCRKNADGAISVRRLSESKTVREQIDIFSLGEIWTAAGDDDLAIPVDSAAVVEEVAP